MFRLDRLITLRLVNPWMCIQRELHLNQEDHGAVPILMYHGINADPEPGVPSYYRLNTSPDLFRAHLQVLQEEGYQTVHLNDLMATFAAPIPSPKASTARSEAEVTRSSTENAPVSETRSSAPSKTAVITFDDGFDDFRTAAWPILQEFGFTATMFLPTAFIGHQRRTFKGRPCLTWGEVKELHTQGVEFGSHTVNHPKLWELDVASVRGELTESREVIEQELGSPVLSFAHPYAFPFTNKPYVERFKVAVSQAGYRCSVTTSLGRARRSDNRFALKRLPANGADDALLFAAKLRGSYDWLSRPQRWFKSMKGVLHRE